MTTPVDYDKLCIHNVIPRVTIENVIQNTTEKILNIMDIFKDTIDKSKWNCTSVQVTL